MKGEYYKIMEWAEITLGQIVNGALCTTVIGALVVEILPFIKFSPLAWLGKRINADINKKVDALAVGQKANEKKLDEHIAQSYRSKILNFQDKLLRGNNTKYSQEEWVEVIDAITKYEKYVEDNEIDNGFCVMAIDFIKHSYADCLRQGAFVNLRG